MNERTAALVASMDRAMSGFETEEIVMACSVFLFDLHKGQVGLGWQKDVPYEEGSACKALWTAGLGHSWALRIVALEVIRARATAGFERGLREGV